MVSETENASEQRDLKKWSKLSSSTASDALELSKQRASDTKARLLEIEDDMVSRQERQLAREKRAANLRRILTDDYE